MSHIERCDACGREWAFEEDDIPEAGWTVQGMVGGTRTLHFCSLACLLVWARREREQQWATANPGVCWRFATERVLADTWPQSRRLSEAVRDFIARREGRRS